MLIIFVHELIEVCVHPVKKKEQKSIGTMGLRFPKSKKINKTEIKHDA
jgi:hypothetical protein